MVDRLSVAPGECQQQGTSGEYPPNEEDGGLLGCCCSRLHTLKSPGAFPMEVKVAVLGLRPEGTGQAGRQRGHLERGMVRREEPFQRRDPTLALSTAAPAGSPRGTALGPPRALVTLISLGPEHPKEEGGVSLGPQPASPVWALLG